MAERVEREIRVRATGLFAFSDALVLPGTEGTIRGEKGVLGIRWDEVLVSDWPGGVKAEPRFQVDFATVPAIEVVPTVNLDDAPAMPKVGQRVRAKVDVSVEWGNTFGLVGSGTEGTVVAVDDRVTVEWGTCLKARLHHDWDADSFEILPDAEPPDAGPSGLTDGVRATSHFRRPPETTAEPFRGETLSILVSGVPVEVTVGEPQFHRSGDRQVAFIPITSREYMAATRATDHLMADHAEAYANAILRAVRAAKRQKA